MRRRLFVVIIFAVAAFFYVLFGEDHLSLFDRIHEDVAHDQNEVQKVVYIVDGDTFDIASGDRIRLIGIDTPERGELYYQEAKDHLSEMILGKNVILKKDVSHTDKYGRLLRHVYIEDVWINKQMIEDGYAHAVTFAPDIMHEALFRSLEQKAKEQGIGLWRLKNDNSEKNEKI